MGSGLRVVALAAAVTAAITLTGIINRPAVTLAAGDAIDIGAGISVTPAPGWSIGDQGPGWVTLHNTYSTAEMEIRVKPANGTDAVALLQADIDQLATVSATGLTNVHDMGAPDADTLQGGRFQQEASINYSADGSSRMGDIPVIGAFYELLSTSSHQSAFIVFTQNGDSSTHSDNDAAMMINSML
ncbi:hypothetical protein [Mycobacterium basiliense]|nr:hypothetical protein [Mycobacterium basiliense]